MSGYPMTDMYGRQYADPFRVGAQVPSNVALTGRTREEAQALYASEGAKMKAASYDNPYASPLVMSEAHFLQNMNHMRARGMTKEADQMEQDYYAQKSRDKQEAIRLEREFFKIANEVDKMATIERFGRQVPNVRGPQEAIRRAEQKTAVYDQAARERRRRNPTLKSSRGGGSSSRSSVVGLSSSTYRKTLLGS